MLSENECTQLTNKLMDEGGAVIHYLTRTRILNESRTPQETNALLADPVVRTWLARLEPGQVHGSKATELENVFGKLAHLGLTAEVPEIVATREWAMEYIPPLDGFKTPAWNAAWDILHGEIFCTFLLSTGLDQGNYVRAFVHDYLERLHIIPREGMFDFYMTDEEKAAMRVPTAYLDKPIIRPEVIHSTIRPTIYTLMLMAVLPPAWKEEYAEIIDDTLDWILDPRMQSMPDGYGYGYWRSGGTPHSHGWSPHLPGYFDMEDNRPIEDTRYLHRVLLMAQFPRARQSEWFLRSVAHLFSFQTDDGDFEFPAQYLQEKPAGYFVNGSYMGLGENRRSRAGRRLEATYYAVRLAKLISQ